ncbi:MAG TPA: acyloxyacyl hydrolase [Candidimonas sp.]|nr:acyloxyacyl hydrolase [Candidimonas sp.]
MHSPTFPPRVPRHLFILSAAIVLAGAVPVHGQPVSVQAPGEASNIFSINTQGHGFGLRYGYHDKYRRYEAVYETPSWWSYNSGGEWGRLDANVELGITYWKAEEREPRSLWQLGATPMLRWWPNDFFYAEIGIGANLFSRTRFANRQLGSAFQFGSHIGVGTLIRDSHRIGIRASHYSNAGINRRNEGLDVLQLTYTYRF